VIISIKPLAVMGVLWPNSQTNSFAGGTREEGHDDVRVSDVGELGALLGETPDVIPEGFTRLLFAASEIP
jgi:hypothetical protein